MDACFILLFGMDVRLFSLQSHSTSLDGVEQMHVFAITLVVLATATAPTTGILLATFVSSMWILIIIVRVVRVGNGSSVLNYRSSSSCNVKGSLL